MPQWHRWPQCSLLLCVAVNSLIARQPLQHDDLCTAGVTTVSCSLSPTTRIQHLLQSGALSLLARSGCRVQSTLTRPMQLASSCQVSFPSAVVQGCACHASSRLTGSASLLQLRPQRQTAIKHKTGTFDTARMPTVYQLGTHTIAGDSLDASWSRLQLKQGLQDRNQPSARE
jgi:hypothetical protein